MSAGTEALDTTALEALLGPQLTPEQARAIYAQGPEAGVFALLSLAKRLAEQRQASSRPDPSTPPGRPRPTSSPRAASEPGPKAPGPDTKVEGGPRLPASTAARNTPCTSAPTAKGPWHAAARTGHG